MYHQPDQQRGDANAEVNDVNQAHNFVSGANVVNQNLPDNKVPVNVHVNICNNTTNVVIAVVILLLAVVVGFVKVVYWPTLDSEDVNNAFSQPIGEEFFKLKPDFKFTVAARKLITLNRIPVDIILSDNAIGKSSPQTVDQFSDYIEYDHGDKYVVVNFYSDENIEVNPSTHKLLLQSNNVDQKLSVVTHHNSATNILKGYYQVGAKKTDFQLTLSLSLHKYTIQITYERPFLKVKLESVEENQNVVLQTGLRTFFAPNTDEATISLQKSNIEIECVPNLPFTIPLYKSPLLQEFFIVEKAAKDGKDALLVLAISIGQGGEYDFIQSLLLQ